MNILYGLARPDEGEILLDGEPVTITGPTDAIARGINMVHQHFMLVPVFTVAENILLGDETMANPVFLDRKESSRRIRELGQRFGFEIDPGRQGRLVVGGLAAAGRDPQGALPRCADPGPRRADRGPDAAGDRGDLPGPAPPRRRGSQHPVHQPQALRGPRDRRPDHGHPAGQGGRRADPVRDERGRPRRADGRAGRRADGGPWRVAPGGPRPDDHGPAGLRRPGQSRRPRRRPRGPGRRDPRHRRRRGQRAGRAGRGDHRAAQGRRRPDRPVGRGRHRRTRRAR